jgi:MoxR-like ATPase
MVMRHRLVLSYEAEAEQMDADAVIASLLAAVSVP